MKFAVHQPNFMPWLGYFAKLASVDAFVILDDVQMPVGRSYVSRTKIRGGADGTWLSLSTQSASASLISEVELAPDDLRWRERHLNLLTDRYRKSPFLDRVFPVVQAAYAAPAMKMIDFNMCLIRSAMALLDITTPLRLSSEFHLPTTSDERIADIGRALGATQYVSGSGGNNYQSEETYARSGIELRFVAMEIPKDVFSDPGFSILHQLFEAGPERVAACLRSAMITESAS